MIIRRIYGQGVIDRAKVKGMNKFDPFLFIENSKKLLKDNHISYLYEEHKNAAKHLDHIDSMHPHRFRHNEL